MIRNAYPRELVSFSLGNIIIIIIFILIFLPNPVGEWNRTKGAIYLKRSTDLHFKQRRAEPMDSYYSYCSVK